MFLNKLSGTVAFMLFSLFSLAQTPMNKYDRAWKKIDSLIGEKGLTASALTETDKVYAMAKAEKKDAQMIKALIYRMGLQSQKEEDAGILGIQRLEKEIVTAPEPAKSILNSLLANRYWNYLQQNRYKFYNRTETVNFNKSDIATWTLTDLHKKISSLFLASLKNEKLLQQTNLEPYDPIIIGGNVRYLRPTLFDLLAHRALEYFRNDERTITQPADVFSIDRASAFDPAADFITRKFPTIDSLSLHHKALLLYQLLIGFHLNDKKPDALIDADLARLAFVHQNASMENKDELYILALTHITAQYSNQPAAAAAWAQLATQYAAKAEQDTAFSYDKAVEIAKKLIAANDSSAGTVMAQQLLNNITRKNLQLNAEMVNLPAQPFRILANYRNIAQVYIRILPISPSIKKELNQYNWWDAKRWEQLSKLASVKSYTQPLPADNDYRDHSTELKIDALPVGDYILLASTTSDFDLQKSLISAQPFVVSGIAYVNNGNNFFVVNRESGAPLSRADVQVWYNYYDAGTRKYLDRKGENLVTDKNGFFSISASNTKTNNQFRLEINTPGDRLFLDELNYNAHSSGEVDDKDELTSYLFTDRAIYRPGQTVWFKGIMVRKNEKSTRTNIAEKQKTTITLYDANNEAIDSLELSSNEFGSYSGKFVLPANKLNGRFRIEDAISGDQTDFSVEEYKRPKFNVTIEKPAGTYRVNDSISVKGTAIAFAGNNIDGANVKYRVVRRVRWRIWYDYMPGRKIWPPVRENQQEIASGEVKTNANGEFIIRFKAIPDAQANKKDQPTFYYEVTADVTDINGETHSASNEVAVAYHAINISIDTPEELKADSLKKLKIRTENLNDIFEKATVTVCIYPLRQPDRIFRQRLWNQPDRFLYSKEEFYRLFPYDVYQDEDQPSSWPRGEKIAEYSDTSSASSDFRLPVGKLAPGWYSIEASTRDKFGETVKTTKQVHLTGNVNTNPAAFASIQPDKKSAEPGETIRYTLTSNLDSVWLIHHRSRPNSSIEEKFLALNKNSQTLNLDLTEADRGNIGLDIVFVKHNRVYSENTTLVVPFTNKELSISYETFRDKLLPGNTEKWKVKISGYKADKVAAEMLTAMYDASLDQFVSHSWSAPTIWSDDTYPQIWKGDAGFRVQHSQTKDMNTDEAVTEYNKVYDQLLTSVFENYGVVGGAVRFLDKNSAAPGSSPKFKERGEEAAQSIGDRNADNESGLRSNYSMALPEIAKEEASAEPIQIRRNFNETAFFLPELKTDSAGNIEFSFTMPEALTQWKWMLLAHTKDLAFGYSEKTIVTQKDLMVQPNAPRFFREGDRMDFTTKIVNLNDKELTGQVELQMIDPATNQPVDGWFRNFFPNQYFTVPARQSVPASFTIEIPFQYHKPVSYRLIARSGNISDGEEMMLPVISNSLLVTESLPLNMRGSGSKQFRFSKLLNSANSETLTQQGLTVEFSSNPAWYAVQALPYLMDYPYECAEQTFNRFYANALAGNLVSAAPKLKAVFEKWKTIDSSALQSNLEKNPELKSILLQETPWVLDAKNESQQKRNIALLFDMARMSRETTANLSKLAEMQLSNGGFPWFNGGRDDRYITQYIFTGVGHLKKLNALPSGNLAMEEMLRKGIDYLDKRVKEDYDLLLKNKANLEAQQLSYIHIQYLYMRSFFADASVPGEVFKAYNFYRKQAQKYWVKESRYMQGMIALSLFRTGDVQTANSILKSLDQNALKNEEMGMYWKEFNTAGYYWYQSPIEAHALLTEAFSEIGKDAGKVADLKTWLLKQKQGQNWRTTKATADACYVLLKEGSSWVTEEPKVDIRLGDIRLSSANGAEAGTGYFKKIIEAAKLKPDMGNIAVTVQSAANLPSWGAVYWQYFEQLDKITPAATPLTLVKKLFVEKNGERGPVLHPIKDGEAVHVGDKIKVRVELRSDRNLEYVHMKDMRAATLEPVNVISQYKWQGGLGYYESTKDASTHFFFNYLSKGTYVFEYTLFVTHTGTFSNGVTTIQCMYAPEFTSHSEGIKIMVE